MRVKITRGWGWFEGMEGQEFDVYPGKLWNTENDVYRLAEDMENENIKRFIFPANCELVPEVAPLASELETLRARLALTEAALAGAGEYLDFLRGGSHSMEHAAIATEKWKAYAAARARLAEGAG